MHIRKTSISKTKKDISKRKTPFFCILKGLSNKQKLFFVSCIGERERKALFPPEEKGHDDDDDEANDDNDIMMMMMTMT